MAVRRRRELTQSSRPISAIYIGKDPLSQLSIPNSQDTPPPPPLTPASDPIPESPTHPAARVQRQLPSPPNTLDNRSTGDSASSQTGTLSRKASVPSPSPQPQDDNELSMPEHNDDDDNDHVVNEDDEDNTAKLSGDLRFSSSSSTLPAGALARVKSLAERNRELTRRLSSLSRRDTPSPLGPVHAVENKSSRLSWTSISGSETERETTSSSSRLDALSTTVRRSMEKVRESSQIPETPSPPITNPRQRLISAPTSPGQTQSTLSSRSVAAPPSKRRRSSAELVDKESNSVTFSKSSAKLQPITGAADTRMNKEETSTVTFGRVSPIGTGRRQRQPLPHEFRDSQTYDQLSVSDLQSISSLSSRSGRALPLPPQPPKSSLLDSSSETRIPMAPRVFRPSSRSATLRESRSSPFHHRAESEQSSPQISDDIAHVGRRQNVRRGSADSMIAQRSVAGESLRAAGLAVGRTEDVFSESGSQNKRLSNELGVHSRFSQADERKERRRSAQTLSRSETTSLSNQRPTTRPSTSLALFQSDDRSPRTGQPLLRQKVALLPIHDRTSPMVFGSRQTEYSGNTRNVHTPPTPSHRRSGRNSSLRALDKGSISAPASEHAKLMLDSLSMFESHLARLPVNSNASLSATTIPDLYHNAQSVIQSANTLNILLREGNTHALEEQIEAEIQESNGDVDVSEIWRSIGSEYRETLRVSDELVRTMTGFLLGMGKILREATVIKDSHNDEEVRVNSPIGSHGAASRRSGDSRRSLEFPIETSPRERERYRDESLRRIATQSSTRAASVLGTFRPQRIESDEERGGESTERPQKSAITGVRKIFSVRNVRPKSSSAAVTKPVVVENLMSRVSGSIPPPLETLPSETNLQRSPVKSVRRRQGTITSRTAFPSVFSASHPTTAVTATTVTNLVGKKEIPSQRTISANSGMKIGGRGESAVNGLQKRFETDTRMRSSSTSSSVDSERIAAVIQGGDEGGETGFEETSTVHKRKDRRRTVTEVFSRVN